MPKPYRRDKPTASRPGKPRALSELLARRTGGTDVQVAVSQGTEGLERSRAWVAALLPADLACQVTQALERRGELVVFTESAAWAGRLKLALEELRPKLEPRLPAGGKLVVRVMPAGGYRR